jgi:hypothetical protein
MPAGWIWSGVGDAVRPAIFSNFVAFQSVDEFDGMGTQGAPESRHVHCTHRQPRPAHARADPSGSAAGAAHCVLFLPSAVRTKASATYWPSLALLR